MREKPILFSGEMVRAILDGRKTQTRRVVKGNPNHLHFSPFACKADDYHDEHGNQYSCPYGARGTRLWVRETFALGPGYNGEPPGSAPDWSCVWYRADGKQRHKRRNPGARAGKWRPSIHMPRWASRITLEVKDVRVERVQDISYDYAVSEGVRYDTTPLDAFIWLWDSINAKRGHGWDTNPWVWVVEFKRVK